MHQNSALKSAKLHKISVLIDTDSTCSVFNDRKMLVNVKTSKKYKEYTLTAGTKIPSLLETCRDF